MKKIANTSELTRELQRIIAYSQSELPSRERLASELRSLSARLAGHGNERQASFGSDNKEHLEELRF